jgi:hypothetical protein
MTTPKPVRPGHWDGGPDGEWDIEAHKEWCRKWAPPCPDGHPQRLQRALGFRERNLKELELRIPLGGRDGGACQVIVDEHDDEVYVRVLVCQDEDLEELRNTSTVLYACGWTGHSGTGSST